MKWFTFSICAFMMICGIASASPIEVGADILMQGYYDKLLKGKKVGLITNHTAVNGNMLTTVDLVKAKEKEKRYTLIALFAPEHGINGASHASDHVDDDHDEDGIPIYSLHGTTRRPTDEMLKGIDLLIYDIQDIGSRSYTYISTLFYVMEEAAKKKIPVIVLDRPNPINGLVIDGPILEEKWRSFVGYLNVPYCHGMTVGELANYFNQEYKIKCPLTVVPMKGWSRSMTFTDTGLAWIPTSPHIPEATTPLHYPTTGILGELQIVNIGIGYTLPFKLVGAPWINAELFAQKLNEQNFPGVKFKPFYFKPFFGKFAKTECSGVMISITDPVSYLPVATQYLIIGMLKSLYPKEFEQAIIAAKKRKEMFCKVNGTEEVFQIMTQDQYIIWKLRNLHHSKREQFKKIRQRYLLPNYHG